MNQLLASASQGIDCFCRMEFSGSCTVDERVRHRLAGRVHVWEHAMYDIFTPSVLRKSFAGQ